MKINFEGEDIFIIYLSQDADYVIATKDKSKKSGFFKLNMVNLPSLNKKDLNKLKTLYK